MRNGNAAPWTKDEDDKFRALVDRSTAPATIAAKLNREIADLKRRGYLLGLPRKWFKAPVSN
jgi:hypothetical protein